MTLGQQIEQLSEKARKYDQLKGRYAEYGEKIMEASRLLQEKSEELATLAEDIDPYLTVQKKEERRSRFDYSEVTADALNKVHQGTEMTTEKLSQLFPALTDNQITYLFNKLRENGAVDERKDGRRVVLYSKRT